MQVCTSLQTGNHTSTPPLKANNMAAKINWHRYGTSISMYIFPFRTWKIIKQMQLKASMSKLWGNY